MKHKVVDLNNGIPDITRGLMKRPGSDLVKAITPAASGKWFPIYRDQTETYIGQVATDGSVKIFRCSDGVEIPVDYINVLTTSNANSAATYLVHTNPEDIQAVTVNETTLFANRTKNTAMLTDSTNKTDAVVNEAFVDLRTITYGKQYALDIFDPDIIQFPLNILDQRFLNINFSLFKKRIEFHARSIFLQGLLLNDIKKLPRFFFPIKKKLEEIHNFFNIMEINMLEACICFAIQQKKVNHFIIGVDKYVQLKNIITIFKKKEIRKIDFSQFSINQEKFIDPRNWKKL